MVSSSTLGVPSGHGIVACLTISLPVAPVAPKIAIFLPISLLTSYICYATKLLPEGFPSIPYFRTSFFILRAILGMMLSGLVDTELGIANMTIRQMIQNLKFIMADLFDYNFD